MDAAVTLPYSRLVTTALALGGQDVNACPPILHSCWMRRGAKPYLAEVASVDKECSECWLAYLLLGE